jgi:hypothetical protein
MAGAIDDDRLFGNRHPAFIITLPRPMKNMSKPRHDSCRAPELLVYE